MHCALSDDDADQVGRDSEEGPNEKITSPDGKHSLPRMRLAKKTCGAAIQKQHRHI
jgi:hypothetical protein